MNWKTRQSASHRRYSLNENYFADIVLPAQAYWLGFLAADSGITPPRRIVLRLARRDRAQLIALNCALESSYPIKDRIVDRKYAMSDLTILSYRLLDGLARYGVTSDKSHTFCWPEELPVHLAAPFLLGSTDGDGCFTRSDTNNQMCWGLLGTYQFLQQLQTVLAERLAIRRHNLRAKGPNGQVYELRIAQRDELTRLVRWLYRNAPASLTRKKEVILPLLGVGHDQ